ncbi:MAG TPA: methyltransferase domain-containing protein [Nitrososphaerales archaeon]|nr:methyltransferase domain-containing protein [Nitrososphaerales archaeon]
MSSQEPCRFNCELFGKRAHFWESTVVPLWQESYHSLVKRARVAEGSAALDVGTGSGEVAIRLASLVGDGGRVVGIDSQPEMLEIARRKASGRGLRNVEFREMPMESMDLADGAFDSVVASYSLCCCTDYRATLEECFRVLSGGGRLTYDHGGPNNPPAYQVITDLFEEYKPKAPSKKLKEMRESEASQAEAVEEYLDPFATLKALRDVGFADAEATLTRTVLRYGSVESYVDEWLLFDWALEAEEMPPATLARFRKAAAEALAPQAKGGTFDVERDTIFFTGVKQ